MFHWMGGFYWDSQLILFDRTLIIEMREFDKRHGFNEWRTSEAEKLSLIVQQQLHTLQVQSIFHKSHVIAKHIEGRANNMNNFTKPINISRSQCISQWDILTDRWAAWALCVTCWRNESHDLAPWNGYINMTKFKTSFYMLSIHYWSMCFKKQMSWRLKSSQYKASYNYFMHFLMVKMCPLHNGELQTCEL